MRIAQVSPLIEAVPPQLYGGTERIVSWLVEELVKDGHEVSLFATADSRTSATLLPMSPKALRLAGIRDHTASTLVMLDHVRRRATEFDVIHFHVDLLQFPMFQDMVDKCVTTLHGRVDLPDFRPAYEAFSAMPLISISDAQRASMPATSRWLASIHHGMPTDLYSLGAGRGGYLAYLGRIAPEKRPDRAIEIAKRARLPLKMAAKVDPMDQHYFSSVIKPLLDDPLIEFIGEVGDEHKAEFLGNAMALLFPIDWPEPFGLVMIEALSTGTPVVAWPMGSAPEVIEDGVTGLLVESIDAAVQGINHVLDMDRGAIRRRFEERFSATRMARDYVAAYEKLIDRGPRKRRRSVAGDIAQGASYPMPDSGLDAEVADAL
jgi:glycosyltransferase involved in cell wall biosynthesis